MAKSRAALKIRLAKQAREPKDRQDQDREARVEARRHKKEEKLRQEVLQEEAEREKQLQKELKQKVIEETSKESQELQLVPRRTQAQVKISKELQLIQAELIALEEQKLEETKKY